METSQINNENSLSKDNEKLIKSIKTEVNQQNNNKNNNKNFKQKLKQSKIVNNQTNDKAEHESDDQTQTQTQTQIESKSEYSESNFDDTVDDENSEEQLKADKLLVYAHPLFPLLALLFEKCEQATHSIHSFETDSSLKSFDTEIAAYIEHHQKSGISIFTNNPEVDSLMIRSIQVFRIHLLELEKVSVLCADFCARYMNCLKSKMRSDVLLRGTSLEDDTFCEASSTDNMDIDGDCCLLNETHNDSQTSSDSSSFVEENILYNLEESKNSHMFSNNANSNNNNNDSSPEKAVFNISYESVTSSPSSCSVSSKSISGISSPSGSLVSLQQSPSSPPLQGDLNAFISDPQPFENALNNKNFSIEHLLSFNDLKVRSESVLPLNFAELLQAQLLSNVGLVKQNSALLSFAGLEQTTPNVSTVQGSNAMDLTVKRCQEKSQTTTENECETNQIKSVREDGFERNKNSRKSTDSKRDKTSRRGILPKHATAIMRTWLFQHIVHPYPTEDEKRAIAAETKLTMLQVNNWFINARRRILQPMLDSANTLQSELCKSNLTNETQSNNTEQTSSNKMSEQKKFKSHSSNQTVNNKFWSQSLANILQTNADLNDS